MRLKKGVQEVALNRDLRGRMDSDILKLWSKIAQFELCVEWAHLFRLVVNKKKMRHRKQNYFEEM